MACIEYPLCKYAHYENGALVCKTGALCSYQRYCSTLLKVIHTSAYKNCKEIKNMSNTKKSINANVNKEATKKVVEKVDIGNDDIIEKSEMCKVIYVDDLIYINFKGFGLIAKNDKGYSDEEIKVFYYGEIGEPNFKFRI